MNLIRTTYSEIFLKSFGIFFQRFVFLIGKTNENSNYKNQFHVLREAYQ